MFTLSEKLWPLQCCTFFSVSPLELPDVTFADIHDVQLLWHSKQSQEGDSVLAEHSACVATSQLLLRDITADNLL